MEMFYKTTFLLIICCFATVLASTEFGCQFKSKGYDVQRTGQGTVWPDAVWGKRPPPLVVGSRADLQLFQAKMKEAREKVFKEHLFDQAGPYLTMIDNMPDNKKNIFQGKGGSEFERWFADFQPILPGRQDELGIMMLIINQLSQYCQGTKWAKVKESYFFAAVQNGVTKKALDKLDEEEKTHALKEKDINELIGVIHVIVDSVPGYILIDLDHYMDSAPFIQNPRDPRTRYSMVKTPYSMEHRRVTINVYRRVFIHLKKDSNPSPMSKLIYVERPLCSILRTANVMMRHNPVITYGKLNAQGDMLAYVLTRYLEAKDFYSPFCQNMDSQDTFCVGYLTTDQSTNEKKLVERTLRRVQNMSPADKEFLQTVAGKMFAATDFRAYDELMQKMTKLDNYMIEYKKEKGKKRVESSTNSSWNSVIHQAAKIKDKMPSLCGRGKG